MLQRARFEANGETPEDVKDQLVEEIRALCSRHRGRSHWLDKMEIIPSAMGYWGHVTLTRTDEPQFQGYPLRKEAVEREHQ